MTWPIFKNTNHPLWFMRQAGRYLPEYRELREKYPSFIDLCFCPQGIIDVSVQPLNRFQLDACIIFSDILILPYLLGQDLIFDPKPRLSRPDFVNSVTKIPEIPMRMQPIQRAIRALSATLEIPVIGFCGAPYTLAHYMKLHAYNVDWANVLWTGGADVLFAQIEAGVKMVQIFDSWAKDLHPDFYKAWIKEPLTKMVKEIHKKYPNFPILYYGRGISHYYKELAHLPIGFSVDEMTDMKTLIKELPENTVLQGNISPLRLLNGDFETDLKDLIELVKDRKHIFNLGQGILPSTPISHVERFIEILNQFRIH